MKKLLTLMLSAILLLSCSKKETYTITEKDGVKTYKSSTIPFNKDFPFNPKQLFTINKNTEDKNYLNFFDLDMLDCDSNGNIYLADLSKTPKVNKYDREGKFVTTFLQKGTGPGEVAMVSFLCVKNDTIYVGDWNTGEVSLFNQDGKFLNEIRPKGNLFSVKALGKNRFVGTSYGPGNNDQSYKRSVLLLDNSLNPIKSYDEAIMPNAGKMNLQGEWLYTTASEKKIYLGVQSENNYKVKVMNNEGSLETMVEKNYSAINFTEDELNRMNTYVKKIYGDRVIERESHKRKFSICGVYLGKDETLFVQPAVDTERGNNSSITLDIFKNNIFQKRTTLPLESPYFQADYSTFLKFIGDRIYLVDGEKNCLTVYEY